jgi:hypothetical protein
VKFGQESRKHIEGGGDLPLKGMKVGVLKEGFQDPVTDLKVRDHKVRRTRSRNKRDFDSTAPTAG